MSKTRRKNQELWEPRELREDDPDYGPDYGPEYGLAPGRGGAPYAAEQAARGLKQAFANGRHRKNHYIPRVAELSARNSRINETEK